MGRTGAAHGYLRDIDETDIEETGKPTGAGTTTRLRASDAGAGWMQATGQAGTQAPQPVQATGSIDTTIPVTLTASNTGGHAGTHRRHDTQRVGSIRSERTPCRVGAPDTFRTRARARRGAQVGG
jgi:hypothetical protein